MGLVGEIEAEAEKVERALIADIVRMLPLVPDQVWHVPLPHSGFEPWTEAHSASLTRAWLQLAYWWVCHAGPLNCGPDKATVEKDLLLKHHHKK
jgi:hypothetical protein